jgi:hypothetical protein
MSTKDDGGQAFPVGNNEGMTLRDYFAAQALNSLSQQYFAVNGACIGGDHLYTNLPVHAYRMADAMLKARQA